MTTEEILEKSKLDWYRDNNKLLAKMLKEKDTKLRELTAENQELKKQLAVLKQIKEIL